MTRANLPLPPPERAAVLRWVAAKIVANPESYDFYEVDPADDVSCGSPHCLLGWAAPLVGEYTPSGPDFDEPLAGIAERLGFESSPDMDADAHFYSEVDRAAGGDAWRTNSNAIAAAQALRAIAQRIEDARPAASENAA